VQDTIVSSAVATDIPDSDSEGQASYEVIARVTFHSKLPGQSSAAEKGEKPNTTTAKDTRAKEFSYMFAPTKANYLAFLQTILKKHHLTQYTVTDQSVFPCKVQVPPSRESDALYVINFDEYKDLANKIIKKRPKEPITVSIDMLAVEEAFSKANRRPYFYPLVAAGATAGVLLTPILAPAALGVVGFSALGPVAGTLAASIQAGIGNVVAGSLFATAQSVAMGGAIPAAITAIGASVGAAGGAVAGASLKKK